MSSKALGVLCLVLAFWSGSQRDFTWGLFGFLSFFCLSIALFTRRKWQGQDKDKSND
jgi:hypothetical protein